MKGLIEKALQYKTDRRSFIGAAALATAGLSMLNGLKSIPKAKAQEMASKDGEWVSTACWHNCGGRCYIQAYVVDGIPVKVKTDDTHPDSPDFPQQRACARGWAQRHLVYGADRLKYPMKRKNWSPGNPNGELRGRDEWERLSWDEALDYVAGELKRVKESYGNNAIMIPGWFYIAGGVENQRVLSLFGGFSSSWGIASQGAWPPVEEAISGAEGVVHVNDRRDLLNSKLMIMWGLNPAISSAGNPTSYFHRAKKEAGTKFVFITPEYNDTAQALGDEWIPIRPGTDTAMLLAMAYVMIDEDLHDQEFLDKCCIGFDEDHMPEGADPKDNFKDYVLGTYDGQPKTPEWAAEICGVDAETIANLAREYATTKPAGFIASYGPARIHKGEQFPHAFLTVGFMSGNIGLPGGSTGRSPHTRSGNGGPPSFALGPAGVPAIINPVGGTGGYRGVPDTRPGTIDVNVNETWDAILTGEYNHKGEKRNCNIKLLYNPTCSALNQLPGMKKGIEAFRSVEFVVTHAHYLTSNAKYSDVVLPVTTPWENYGGFLFGHKEIVIFYSQVSEPLFEAKSDRQLAMDLGKKLGVDVSELFPKTEEEICRARVAGARGLPEEWGAPGSEEQYQNFKKKGIFQAPPTRFIALEDFRKDPEANPLNTESGKLEIYSRRLAEDVSSYGWNVKDPLPKYDPPLEGFEEADATYPLQFWTPHHKRRAHSAFDNAPWLREAFAQDAWMHPNDAKERGIEEGDVVKISSRHGSTIRTVHITERLYPKTVAMGEGAWVEMDEKREVDTAGATNMINGDNASGRGHCPWNSTVCQVEKWTETTLEPDHKWPQRIVL